MDANRSFFSGRAATTAALLRITKRLLIIYKCIDFDGLDGWPTNQFLPIAARRDWYFYKIFEQKSSLKTWLITIFLFTCSHLLRETRLGERMWYRLIQPVHPAGDRECKTMGRLITDTILLVVEDFVVTRRKKSSIFYNVFSVLDWIFLIAITWHLSIPKPTFSWRLRRISCTKSFFFI